MYPPVILLLYKCLLVLEELSGKKVLITKKVTVYVSR